MTPKSADDNVAATACESCGADLAEGQDWCLSCGTAAPGRLARRPGSRAALAMVAVTLAVTGGAVAVSYAALSDPPVKKGEILYPYQVAQQAPAETQPTTATKTAAKTPTRRAVTSKPSHDDDGFAPLAKSSPPSPPPADLPKTPAPDEPKKPELSSITIPAGGGALYDPSARGIFLVDDPHDPAAAFDDDDESSWAVTSNGEGDLLVGYVVDLGRAQSLQRVELLTDTPGFRAEIFGAKADTLPPQIDDPQWVELKSRDDVDGTTKEDGKVGDGKERITVGDGSKKYRFVLVWFTTPAPTVAPDPPSRTVRLFDLKLFG